jgi:biopolymer transport protein ExbD
MKFPRNARVFRGTLEFTPYASVFFLLVLFVMLVSLVHTPGVRLNLPIANDLPGTDKPSVHVAIDSNGRLYYRNQTVSEEKLKSELQSLAQGMDLTLVILLDKAVAADSILKLTLLAREAGITNSLLATLPRYGDETVESGDAVPVTPDTR